MMRYTRTVALVLVSGCCVVPDRAEVPSKAVSQAPENASMPAWINGGDVVKIDDLAHVFSVGVDSSQSAAEARAIRAMHRLIDSFVLRVGAVSELPAMTRAVPVIDDDRLARVLESFRKWLMGRAVLSATHQAGQKWYVQARVEWAPTDFNRFLSEFRPGVIRYLKQQHEKALQDLVTMD